MEIEKRTLAPTASRDSETSGVTKAMTKEAGDNSKSERTMGRCVARWGGSIRR